MTNQNRFLKVRFIFLFFMLNINSGENTWGYAEELKNLSFKENEKNGILVIAYNRPDNFKKVIESLEKNPESQTLPFVFVLDGGENATQSENIELIQKSKIKKKYMYARTENYGCGRSILDARRMMFEWCCFEKIIVFEDDLVVSPEYISLTFNLYEWAKKNYDNVGVVQAFTNCFLHEEQKKKYLNQVKTTYGYFWGYCLDMQVYSDIKDFLNEYEQLFLLTSDNLPNHSKIADWMKEKMQISPQIKERKIPNIIDYQQLFFKWIEKLYNSPEKYRNGQDIEMRMALYLAGYVKISTVVNRAIYIGKNGFHHDDIHWRGKGFDNIKLHRFLGDSDCKEFISVQHVPDRLKILFIINKNINSNWIVNIDNLFHGLLDRGHDVYFLTTERHIAHKEGLLEIIGIYDYKKRLFVSIPEGEHFDVVVYGVTSRENRQSVEIKYYKKLTDRLIAYVPLFDLEKINSDLFKNIEKDCDLFITTSNFFAELLETSGINKDKIEVVYPTVNRCCYSELPFEKNYDKPSILITENIFGTSDTVFLLKLLYIFFLKNGSIKCKFFLKKDIEPEIENLIKYMKKFDNFSVEKITTLSYKRRVLDDTTVFIIAPEYETGLHESLYGSVLEACLLKNAIVSLATPSLEEMFTNSEDIFFIKKNSLSSSIRVLEQAIARSKYVAKNGSEKVEQLCDIEKQLDLFESCLINKLKNGYTNE